MESASRPDGAGPVDRPHERVSDEERHRVVELLGDHASVGRITLGELEERAGQAYTATTRSELAEVTRDLPLPAEPSAPTPQRRSVTRWFIAVFGGSTRRGRQRLSGKVNVVAVFGGDDIDLRQAEVDAGELVINVFSLFGGPDIYVPDSVDVELTGLAIFGGNDEHGGATPARRGSPVIHVRSFALFGGADVWRVPGSARTLGLKEARKAVRKLGR
jgi:hypothetical protein